MRLLLLSFEVLFAGIVSALTIIAIRPWLARHAPSKPNSRSAHRISTPQGAGIAVISATLAIAITAILCTDNLGFAVPKVLFGATLFLTIVGFVDDVKFIPIIPRLLLQATAVAAVIFSADTSLRISAAYPLWLERGLLLLAGLWFVNLVNFMDGLDLLTVSEVIPVTGAIVVIGLLGTTLTSSTVVAAALLGAIAGFAPFNRPVAKIFLGDAGSLTIGLLLGWCLLQLAYQNQIIAALLLPLYYLADTTVTLLRRCLRRERFWIAHRSHFYQRAVDHGFSTTRVVTEIFAVNSLLATLAIGSTTIQSIILRLMLLAVGCAAVAYSMFRFSRSKADGIDLPEQTDSGGI